MLKLTVTYEQTNNLKWNATVDQAPHIRVVQANDLESAKSMLEIITAEEAAYLVRRRPDYEFVSEKINYFQIPEEEQIKRLREKFLGG